MNLNYEFIFTVIYLYNFKLEPAYMKSSLSRYLCMRMYFLLNLLSTSSVRFSICDYVAVYQPTNEAGTGIV